MAEFFFLFQHLEHTGHTADAHEWTYMTWMNRWAQLGTRFHGLIVRPYVSSSTILQLCWPWVNYLIYLNPDFFIKKNVCVGNLPTLQGNSDSVRLCLAPPRCLHGQESASQPPPLLHTRSLETCHCHTFQWCHSPPPWEHQHKRPDAQPECGGGQGAGRARHQSCAICPICATAPAWVHRQRRGPRIRWFPRLDLGLDLVEVSTKHPTTPRVGFFPSRGRGRGEGGSRELEQTPHFRPQTKVTKITV